MNPVERRIRSVSDVGVYEFAQAAFPGTSDEQIISELFRMIVFIAVCWNDIVEDGQDADKVLMRNIFEECNELAEHFPWPAE